MNFTFRKSIFGRFIFAGTTKGNVAEAGRGETKKYYSGQYTVIAYAADGTRTAFFGSGSEKNSLSKVNNLFIGWRHRCEEAAADTRFGKTFFEKTRAEESSAVN